VSNPTTERDQRIAEANLGLVEIVKQIWHAIISLDRRLREVERLERRIAELEALQDKQIINWHESVSEAQKVSDEKSQSFKQS
jgi:hypothetical protein